MINTPSHPRCSFVAMIAIAALVSSGCGKTQPASFRLNMVQATKTSAPEAGLEKPWAKWSQERQSQVATILLAMFGTPDEPVALAESGLDEGRGPGWAGRAAACQRPRLCRRRRNHPRLSAARAAAAPRHGQGASVFSLLWEASRGAVEVVDDPGMVDGAGAQVVVAGKTLFPVASPDAIRGNTTSSLPSRITIATTRPASSRVNSTSKMVAGSGPPNPTWKNWVSVSG